jgi:hypothetical protein
MSSQKRRQRCDVDVQNSFLSHTFMFPYELDAVFEQIFSQKAANAAAG